MTAPSPPGIRAPRARILSVMRSQSIRQTARTTGWSLLLCACVHAPGAPSSAPTATARAVEARADADGAVAADSTFGPRRKLRRSLERHGVTWTFSDATHVGRYVNGDWWAVGPVELVAIEPACSEQGARVRHGAMTNPDPSRRRHGYDSAVGGSLDESGYEPSANAALGVSASRPLKLQPGTSLVSAVSHPIAGQLPQLEGSAVLTVVDAAPPIYAFRPPYCGDDKRSRWTAADLDLSCLAQLQPVPGAPNAGQLVAQLERMWLDHLPGVQGRYLHPRENMPDYGRELSALVGAAALTVNLDISPDDKRALLIALVQLGIDVYGVVQFGGRFAADGGSGSGRKLPLLIAGTALHDDALLRAAREHGAAFGEDAQTFYVEETAPGTCNHGHGGYVIADLGLPEWGNRHADDPSLDQKAWGADPYRRCCTANAWVGAVLAARVMGLRDAWGHPALFDYQDRYMQIEQPGHWMRSWDPFAERMWDRYRDDF